MVRVGQLLVLSGLVTGLADGPTPGAERPASEPSAPPAVYFQVSFADGRVRNLGAVPRSRSGIIRVVRISHIRQGLHGRRIVSTGRQPIREINLAPARRVELAWNGRAWVAPAPKKPSRAATRPGADVDRIKRIQAAARALSRLLPQYEKAVSDAAERLHAARGGAAEKAAAESLAWARAEFLEAQRILLDYERQLTSGASDKDTAARVATGTLSRPDRAPQLVGTLGVGQPVDETGVLAHRTQVWPLPPGNGERSICVSIAHAEAGRFGAFHYVAYADTTGDGRPDKLIARSPLADARTAGGWSTWTFGTAARHVFVGNTWAEGDITHCRRKRRGTEDGYRGLGPEIYVSGFVGGMPSRRHALWPYVHNIRVRLQPAGRPSSDSKVRMIVR